MKTIVGLFEQPDGAAQAADLLVSGGFAPTSIQLVSSVRAVWQHLGCTPGRIVAKDFGIGAALGVALYGIIGLLAAMGEVLMGFGQTIALGAILVFVCLGMLVGGFLGAVFGIADAEQETRLYLNGIRRGGVLLVVRTADEHAPRALEMLRTADAEGVKICLRTSDHARRHGLFGHATPA